MRRDDHKVKGASDLLDDHRGDRRGRASCRSPSAAASATVDDMRARFAHGADKVTINTAAVETPELITEARATLRQPGDRRLHRRRGERDGRLGGRTRLGARRRPGSTPSSGRARPSGAAPARSSSTRSTATARASGYDLRPDRGGARGDDDPRHRLRRRRHASSISPTASRPAPRRSRPPTSSTSPSTARRTRSGRWPRQASPSASYKSISHVRMSSSSTSTRSARPSDQLEVLGRDAEAGPLDGEHLRAQHGPGRAGRRDDQAAAAEAVHLLASSGDGPVLAAVAERRLRLADARDHRAQLVRLDREGVVGARSSCGRA